MSILHRVLGWQQRGRIEPRVATVPAATGKNQGEDSGDDEVRYLLELCDRSPREGLALVDKLSSDDKILMFARVIALRKLAFEKLFAMNVDSITHKNRDELMQLFETEHRAHAEDAVSQIGSIERLHPGYIEGLGEASDRFAEQMVDDVCTVVERLTPGKVQDCLGWTKLRYFGTERVGLVPGVKISAERLSNAMEARLYPVKIARSALVAGLSDGQRSITVALCGKDFRETSTIGDADNFGLVEIFPSGRTEFRSY